MDLTEINSNVDKLKELQNENGNDFFKKYSDFIDDVVTKLKTDIEEKSKGGISKKKERERIIGIDKVQNDISMVFEKLSGYCQQNSTEQGKSRRKTETRIKKLCDEIYDVGINTFKLELENVPDESHRLKNKRSWFSKSIERLSRSSSENDVEETEEEKNLREEIEKIEKDLEEKKKRLSEMRDERKKREKEEKKKEKNNKKEEEKYEEDDDDKKIGEQFTLMDRIEDLVSEGECRQAFELLNNTSLLGTKILGASKSKAPRMFIILPDPDKCPNGAKLNYWLNYKNWNKNVFNLHLLCECPGGIEENIDN